MQDKTGDAMTRKIPARREIQVYVTADCFVGIKQIDYPDEVAVIVVHPDDIQTLIEFLSVAQGEARKCVPEEEG